MKKRPSFGVEKTSGTAENGRISSSTSSKSTKNENIERLLGKLDLIHNEEKFKKDLEALNELESISTKTSSSTNNPDSQYESSRQQKDYNLKEANILSKAKTLLNKAKTENPNGALSNPNKYRVKVSKKDPFLTSIGVVNEQPIKREPPPKDDDFEVEQQINDDEILNSLKADYKKSTEDDLAELRRMIKECQKNISDYAGELYHLKNTTFEANSDALELGYGVNNDIFYDMDRRFEKHMPGGDSNLLFVKKNKKVPTDLKKVSDKPSMEKGRIGSNNAPIKKSSSIVKKGL